MTVVSTGLGPGILQMKTRNRKFDIWVYGDLMGKGSSIVESIKAPLAAVLMLVTTLILAGLSVVSAVSGELTAACVSAAGMFSVILILAMVDLIGRN
jgi:hypothetical protein